MNRLKQKLVVAAIGVLAGFASQAEAAAPAGWLIAGNAPRDYEYGTDTTGAREGGRSAFIKQKAPDSTGFGTLMQTVSPQAYLGSRVRLSAYLRSDGVRRGQMWMRIDGPEKAIAAFDNMDSRPITGTTQWKRYEIVLDVPQDAVDVAFGFFLAGGSGTLWADSFKLEVVDRSVPLTANGRPQLKDPVNLGFEE